MYLTPKILLTLINLLSGKFDILRGKITPSFCSSRKPPRPIFIKYNNYTFPPYTRKRRKTKGPTGARTPFPNDQLRLHDI